MKTSEKKNSKEMAITEYSSEDLKATFQDLVQNNDLRYLDAQDGQLVRLTQKEKQDMLDRKYPKKCITSALSAGKNANKGRSGSDRARKKVSGAQHPSTAKVIVYQLACFFENGFPVGQQTASHLCGRFDCCNPAHVCWESLKVNHTRDCCMMFGSNQEYKCPHSPPCIGFEQRSAA